MHFSPAWPFLPTIAINHTSFIQATFTAHTGSLLLSSLKKVTFFPFRQTANFANEKTGCFHPRKGKQPAFQRVLFSSWQIQPSRWRISLRRPTRWPFWRCARPWRRCWRCRSRRHSCWKRRWIPHRPASARRPRPAGWPWLRRPHRRGAGPFPRRRFHRSC